VNLMKMVESEQLRDDLPEFSVGDRVRVYIKVTEAEKERIQSFEGTVIAKKHGGMNATFTVRRVSYGEGAERIFPLNSPNIDNIEILSRGSKLYYLRSRSGKGSRIKGARLQSSKA
jgi:large subunit ribosomal protein L19